MFFCVHFFIYNMKCVSVCLCVVHWKINPVFLFVIYIGFITFYEITVNNADCILYVLFYVWFSVACLFTMCYCDRKTSLWFETYQTQSTKRHLYVLLVLLTLFIFSINFYLNKAIIGYAMWAFTNSNYVCCVSVIQWIKKNKFNAKICLDLFIFFYPIYLFNICRIG